MLTVKEAVERAFLFVQDIYEAGKVHNLELEEIELSEDEKYWLVTVSFDVFSEAFSLTTKKAQTKFKTMKIDVETREVKSMKIREVYEPASQ